MLTYQSQEGYATLCPVPFAGLDIALLDQRLIQVTMRGIPDAHELDARWRELITGVGDMAV